MKQNTKELLTYGTLFGSVISAASILILYFHQLSPEALPVGDFGLGPAIPYVLMSLMSFGLSYLVVSTIQQQSSSFEVEI